MKSAQQLVEEADAEVRTLAPEEARAAAERGEAVLVDIRDIRELAREGRVPGAVHAPRGMLEFWFDPSSEYHKPVFDQPERLFVLFCAAAGRSALAAKTLQDMGLENVAHMGGGFGRWRKDGLPVERDAPGDASSNANQNPKA